MKIGTSKIYVWKKRSSKEFYTNVTTDFKPIPCFSRVLDKKNSNDITLIDAYRIMCKRTVPKITRESAADTIISSLQWNNTTVTTYKAVQSYPIITDSSDDKTSDELIPISPDIKIYNDVNTVELLSQFINFFSEFSFEPNFRFVNTFNRQKTENSKIAYVTNYFKLTDNPYKDSIIEKMKSIEFSEMLTKFKEINTTTQINKRFKLYYGSQGTGKTTAAMKETNNNVIVCHSAMLPSDLMEDFEFDDGKAGFKPSALYLAMVNGTPITLDEINLLPFESLRFLQSILDGKSQFIYKGKTVEIKDGFQIIGTMNLNVNGATYSLPEPLVDRCSEIKEYKLTTDMLVSALA